MTADPGLPWLCGTLPIHVVWGRVLPFSAALAAMKALRCSSYDSSSRLTFFFFSGEKAGSAWEALARAASMACSTAFSPSVPLQAHDTCCKSSVSLLCQLVGFSFPPLVSGGLLHFHLIPCRRLPAAGHAASRSRSFQAAEDGRSLQCIFFAQLMPMRNMAILQVESHCLARDA